MLNTSGLGANSLFAKNCVFRAFHNQMEKCGEIYLVAVRFCNVHVSYSRKQ